MQNILARRASLHRRLQIEERNNSDLRLQIEKVQSLANIGMVSAMIAHEINNILTPLSSYAEMALMHPADQELNQKAVEKAAKNSQRINKILTTLLSFANGKQQEKSCHQAQKLFEETFSCIARDFKKDGIEIIKQIDSDTQVLCEPISLQQVLLNLVLNARESMLGKGGILTLKAYYQDELSVIEVKDTGSGISDKNLKKIFEPFFTTKTRTDQRHNAGAGLGLAFCKRVIESHNGMISVSSQQGKGTCFKISLPMHNINGSDGNRSDC